MTVTLCSGLQFSSTTLKSPRKEQFKGTVSIGMCAWMKMLMAFRANRCCSYVICTLNVAIFFFFQDVLQYPIYMLEQYTDKRVFLFCKPCNLHGFECFWRFEVCSLMCPVKKKKQKKKKSQQLHWVTGMKYSHSSYTQLKIMVERVRYMWNCESTSKMVSWK